MKRIALREYFQRRFGQKEFPGNIPYMWTNKPYMWARIPYMWANTLYMWANTLYIWTNTLYMGPTIRCICLHVRYICSHVRCICLHVRYICLHVLYICSHVQSICSHALCICPLVLYMPIGIFLFVGELARLPWVGPHTSLPKAPRIPLERKRVGSGRWGIWICNSEEHDVQWHRLVVTEAILQYLKPQQ